MTSVPRINFFEEREDFQPDFSLDALAALPQGVLVLDQLVLATRMRNLHGGR
jgi:hypothetical protein